MLSRTADHLFWMARYMERAENTARMLDVNYQMSLLPQSAEQAEQGWRGVLGISELTDSFAAKYPNFEGRNVMDFMVRDAGNASSISACVAAARENARAVRGTLTTEVWETTNQTWLEFDRLLASGDMHKDPSSLFEWVKFRSHLSRGVTVGTMLQDEALHFLRIGTFLERADNTARLLDVKFQSLAGDDYFGPRPSSSREAQKEAVQEVDFYHWSAVLRSVSGFEVYRKVYRNVIRPDRVAELLILRPDMHECADAQPRPGGQCAKRRHRAPRRAPAQRLEVRPHRRDPRHGPARLPNAIPRPRRRSRCGHQPRLSGADGGVRGLPVMLSITVPVAARTCHVVCRVWLARAAPAHDRPAPGARVRIPGARPGRSASSRACPRAAAAG
jgi:uncharacterized alpha-E superfamily protein